jgi:HEAT repeat protein
MLTDKDAGVRYASVDALGYTGGSGVTDAMKGMFKDTDADVRAAAVRSLGRLRDPASADSLEVLLEDEVVSVRIATVIALGKIGGKRALEILTESLASTELGSLAAAGIQKYGAGAGPVLIAAMPKMPVPARCEIARLLAEAKVIEAVPVLIDNLNNASIDVRFCAQKALKMITGHETSYRCDAPDTERAKGQEEWRAWWKKRREKK